MYKAVIFDMDGVLIDSQPLHYQADMEVLRKCGYPAQLSTVTPYTGVSNPDRWPKYRENLQLQPSIDELITWQSVVIMDIFENEDLRPIPGIPELLAYLAEKGIKMAVASSSSHELIGLVLHKLKIGKYFDIIVSGEDVSNGKPAPDVFLRAAEKLILSCADCVVVEDSPNGIQAAKNAGIHCIAYRNPTTHGQDFTLADYVIDRYEECFLII